MDENKIKQIHSTFSLPSNKIYFNDRVKKINKHGNPQFRGFIITNYGIFLLNHPLIFPKNIKLSKMISYAELMLILVNETTVQFHKSGCSIEIQHPKHVEIAYIVYTCQTALFDFKTWKTKLVLSSYIKERFNSTDFVYDTDTIKGDRFVSLCLSKNSFNVDEVIELREQLKGDEYRVFISPSKIAPQYLNEYSLAISLEYNIREVVFSDVSTCSIERSLFLLLSYNKSLKKLVLDNVKFVDQISNQKLFFNKNMRSLILEINNCNLTRKEFKKYYDIFMYSGRQIESLSFNSCKFNDDIISSICSSMIRSPSMKAIKKFAFTDSPIGCMLTGALSIYFNDQSFLSSQITNIVIEKCNVNIELLFYYIFVGANKVQELNLSHNILTSFGLLKNVKKLQMLKVLDISYTKTNGECLINLFSILAKSKNMLERLVADNISMCYSCWESFYNKMPLYSTNISSLSWINNFFFETKFATSFSKFLSKQPNLDDLSITCTNATHEALVELSDGIQSKIKKITITGEKSVNSNIETVLIGLKSPTYIKIYNQGGGDLCIDLLISYVKSGTLQELYFDGVEPSSLQKLLELINLIMESEIKKSSWPENDIKKIIKETKAAERGNLAIQLEKERIKFENVFNQNSAQSDEDEETSISKFLEEYPISNEPIENLLSFVEPETRSILEECNCSDEVILERVYNILNQYVSIDKLF